MNISDLEKTVTECKKCERLVHFREKIALEKRKAYFDWSYWGKPVPGYGKINEKLMILGLAPAAHGGNRTGRVFTGDKSADFLFKSLYHVGLSNQANSDHRNDGLILDGYITAAVKCVLQPEKDMFKSVVIEDCDDENLKKTLLRVVMNVMGVTKVRPDV